VTRVAVRFLDNVVDVSNYRCRSKSARRRRSGASGSALPVLADALIMCRSRYGTSQSVVLIERWFKRYRRAAYSASSALAAEKGPFPLFDREKFVDGQTVRELDGGYSRLDRTARYSQRAFDLDRADGNDFASGRKRVERDRAGLCLFL